jgi:hypothetical protein
MWFSALAWKIMHNARAAEELQGGEACGDRLLPKARARRLLPDLPEPCSFRADVNRWGKRPWT